MKIPHAIAFFENLEKTSTSKAEIKTCQAFHKVLSSLDHRDWSDTERIKIEGKLAELELDVQHINLKKHLRKKYAELTAFLLKEFSLITEGYYMTQGLIFGMIFGQGLGITIGTAFGVEKGLAIGLSLGTGMGMALGIAFGSLKDAEAKKQGRVLS